MKTWIGLWILLLSSFALADYKRTVHVEWEAIDGAALYEIEWIRVPASPGDVPIRVQVQSASWKGPMAPGIYQMRIRARDKRKVPGDWSPSEEFKVGLDPVVGHSPRDGEVLKSTQGTSDAVSFQWQNVPGAQKYAFEISSEDGSFKEAVETTSPEIRRTLPVAQKYKWQVKAIASDGIVSEKTESAGFTLRGKKLESPQILENDLEGSLRWTQPASAETFAWVLKRRRTENGKWEALLAEENTKALSLPLEKTWIDGTYGFQVVAKAPLREDSDPTWVRFHVKDLNRSSQEEREAFQLRKHWQRREGLYAMARQQVGLINYSSNNQDLSESAHFAALGGHALLGVGHFGSEDWGSQVAVELGGIFLDARTYTASTFELTGVNRSTREDGETRHYAGLFAKELPLLSSTNTLTHTVDRASALGPHYGYEENWSWGERTGLQASFHGYFNFLKLRSPSGENIAPSLSFQASVLGSYRLTPTASGYYGYAFRYDSLSYGTNTSSLSNNSIVMWGHGLNFYLEWAL